VHTAENLTTFMCRLLKSESLSLLEPSGPVQACNGIAFFFLSVYFTTFKVFAAGILINQLPPTKTFTSDFTITVFSALIIFLVKGCKVHIQFFLLQCGSCALETSYYGKLHDLPFSQYQSLKSADD